MSRKASTSSFSQSDDPSVQDLPAPVVSAPPHDPATSLAERWRAVFGSEPPRSPSLIEQALAWQEQVSAHGDIALAIAHDLKLAERHARDARYAISGRAKAVESVPSSQQAHASCNNLVSATTPLPDTTALPVPPRHRRRSAPTPLPPAASQLLPGTRLVKSHGGRNHVVEVTGSGFDYEGTTFASLSAIAKHITGTHWNGLLFFGLRRRKTYPDKTKVASRDRGTENAHG